MPSFLRIAGAALVLGAALPSAAQQPVVLADTARRAPPPPAFVVVTPATDQSRGVDAELRAALFDLVADKPLTALSRLEWLASSKTAMSATPAAGERTREDLLFLLAESYYRLGLSASFRSTTQQLLTLAPAGRYSGMLQMQLMLDAYRRGDYTTARTQATKLTASPDAALSDFVAGLSSYQVGDFASARASFAKVMVGGNPAYAPYARYMDALSAMQGDTAKAPAALDAIAPLAANGAGAFADQVRLTASELAFQGGKYAAAAGYAGQVSPTGGLASDAQLARAWSLYRAGKFDSAATLFGEYATRYPQLPGRDEARLMHGQILLEQHHPADADAYFTLVGDSMGAEAADLQARMNAAMQQASRALVAARAAGAVYVRDAQSGKSLMLAPDAGAEGAVLIAAFGGTPTPVRADTMAPMAVSVGDLQARFAAIAPPLPADLPQRPFYAPASSPKAYGDFAERDQALLAADLSDAVARYRLQAATADHTMRMLALRNLQQLIVEGQANLVEMNKEIAVTQDSLAKMAGVLQAARSQVRGDLLTQSAATAKVAAANIAKLDSVKNSLGSAASPIDVDILNVEMQTALIYRRLSQTVAASSDSAIERHPAFALRNSLAARITSAKALSAEGEKLLRANGVLVSMELARVEGGETDRIHAARQDLTVADQRRSAAEAQMVTLVDAELRTRAARMVDALKRSREAADYGSASAAFFSVLEAKTGPTAATPQGGAAPTPAPEH